MYDRCWPHLYTAMHYIVPIAYLPLHYYYCSDPLPGWPLCRSWSSIYWTTWARPNAVVPCLITFLKNLFEFFLSISFCFRFEFRIKCVPNDYTFEREKKIFVFMLKYVQVFFSVVKMDGMNFFVFCVSHFLFGYKNRCQSIYINLYVRIDMVWTATKRSTDNPTMMMMMMCDWCCDKNQSMHYKTHTHSKHFCDFSLFFFSLLLFVYW